MHEQTWLAERFEENRPHLRAVAYRMLGSLGEAEDAVQESWLRLSRADADGIDNLGGWLTTVVARVCLDMLRSRKSRREEPLASPRPTAVGRSPADPEREAMLAESVGLALLIVLQTLSPAERVAFVLHDMFALPFDAIAPIVGRSPTAARKLASRARRRVRGPAAAPDADPGRERELVAAFLEASREGDLRRLIAVLDPDVVLRADAAAVALGAPAEVRGARSVAENFAGRARAARLALVGGAPGLAWAPGGRPRVAFRFSIARGRILAIDTVADPSSLRRLGVAVAGADGAP